MKKHIAAALAVIIAFTLTSTAYASDTATTDVSLTLSEDDVTPPSSEPEYTGPDYLVHIPASISLNNGTISEENGDISVANANLSFSWTNYRLEDGDCVDVLLDASKTFTDGWFYLTTGDGATHMQQIPCYLTIFATNGGEMSPSLTLDVPVAKFVAPSESPDEWGILNIQTHGGPFYGKDSGTYTGTVHFRIVTYY
jgi:hypothetical protein